MSKTGMRLAVASLASDPETPADAMALIKDRACIAVAAALGREPMEIAFKVATAKRENANDPKSS